MTQKAKKINFMINEAVRKEFETLVPSGERSRIVNEAIRKELELIRRRKASEQLRSAARDGKRFSNREIIKHLRADRGAHE